ANTVLGLATETNSPIPPGGLALWAGVSGTPFDQIKRYDGAGHWTLDIPIQNFRITAVGAWNGKPVFAYSIVGSTQHGISIKTDIGGGWNTFISTTFPTIHAVAGFGTD